MGFTNENLPVEALGIGDALVDLFTHAAQVPPKGGNIWSTAVQLSPGGTTANVAANLAKLGIHSGFVGCVGDDPYGKYMIDEFAKLHMDTSGTIVAPGIYTGIVLAIIDDEGERTFIACAKGASFTKLTEEDVRRINYRTDQVIHTSGVCLGEEPARTALLTMLKLAKASGVTVYFDPNLRLEGNVFPEALRQAQWQAIGLADVVLISKEELELLCPDCSTPEGVARLCQAGAGLVVVKSGENGATVFDGGSADHVPAFKVPVTSTAGAGDSFDAGFIAARLRGASLHDALVYASAVAGVKVTRQGSRAVPGHAEVMGFLAGQGYHLKIDNRE